jgi:asparagine synthase (glutamine-hydrolysing)
MCGIAGAYSSMPPDRLKSQVQSMVQSQQHRGPDFHAIEVVTGRAGSAVMGHNRLSIIDLSALGNQPMWDIERRLCMVYNGEIYNYIELRRELIDLGHRFVSAGDSEVVLESFKQWGLDAFTRFNGMFALAVYDTDSERLVLARDRFGVKPLYYVAARNTVHFASTSTAASSILGLEPDLEYASRGLRYSLYEHDETAPYMDMKAVRPGHTVQFTIDDSGRLRSSSRSYYDLASRVSDGVDSLASLPERDLVERLIELLDDAVRIRLRSDAPVAVSLSGGLDSSMVAAVAARYSHDKLCGFTFGDPKVTASEGPTAAKLGMMADISMCYIWPSISEICGAYDNALKAQGAPFTDASIIAQYLVFKTARAKGFKVLLGGQGGDEAFMGYRKFQAFNLAQSISGRRYAQALFFAVSLLPTFFAERWRWRLSWKSRDRYLKRSGIETVLRLPYVECVIGHLANQSLRSRQVLDVTKTSLPTLLRYEDCNSMGNSVESRLPFLDYRVIEFGIALPEALNLRRGYGKWTLRLAAAGRVPEVIRTARFKKGFDVQQDCWIQAGLGGHIREKLRADLRQTKQWVPFDVDIDEAFSNEQFRRRPAAFAEATTLLWLANAASRPK